MIFEMDAILTEDELRVALFAMENSKSPAVDWLSSNFYKHFWPLLSEKLLHVYNYAFEAGCLSVSQCRGIISLVFKKGDRTPFKVPVILICFYFGRKVKSPMDTNFKKKN